MRFIGKIMRKKLAKQTLKQLIDAGELIPINEKPLIAGKIIYDENAFAKTSWVIYEEK
jgi:hypothetical protein